MKWQFAGGALEEECLKNFSKITDKHQKQSSGGVLSKEKMFLKNLQNSQKNFFAGVSFLIKLQAGKLETFRSNYLIYSIRQGALENFTEKNLSWTLFLIKLQFWEPATLSKKTPT